MEENWKIDSEIFLIFLLPFFLLYLTEDGELLNKKYVKDCFIYFAVGAAVEQSDEEDEKKAAKWIRQPLDKQLRRW